MRPETGPEVSKGSDHPKDMVPLFHTPRAGRSFGVRLKRRKRLLQRRRMIVTQEFVLGMTGFVLMMVVTEFHFEKVYLDESNMVFYMKVIISVTTGMLLLAVLAYYVTEVQLKMTEKDVFDYRMVVTKTFVVKLCVELIVCSFHPFPGYVKLPFPTLGGGEWYVPTDALFSILMLLRLYLAVRFVIVHSHWMMNSYLQGVGALNKVNTDTGFILKCLMRDYPGTLIIMIMLGILLINSWAMRACESFYVPGHYQTDYFNSMWLVTITFLTVGYGDISPNSYCGRFVAAETAMIGVGTTALLVTVVTSKFELTRPERYLHIFFLRMDVQRRKKMVAADIVKLVLRIWRWQKINKLTTGRSLALRVQLNTAVQKMRLIIEEDEKLIEDSINVIDVGISVIKAGVMLEKMRSKELLATRLKRINDKLNTIQTSLGISK